MLTPEKVKETLKMCCEKLSLFPQHNNCNEKKAIELKSIPEYLPKCVFIFSNFLSFLIYKMRWDYKISKFLLHPDILLLNGDLQLNLQKNWDCNYVH